MPTPAVYGKSKEANIPWAILLSLSVRYLVVSLPNMCHGDLVLNLLNRNFKYTSIGLLDETH